MCSGKEKEKDLGYSPVTILSIVVELQYIVRRLLYNWNIIYAAIPAFVYCSQMNKATMLNIQYINLHNKP